MIMPATSASWPAGRDILPYDTDAPLLVDAQASGNVLAFNQGPLDGDIQIAGPGTLEVLAGRDLNLGNGPNNSDGTGVGISSIGGEANPVLPFAGADIVAAAGLDLSAGLAAPPLNFNNTDPDHLGFINLFLDPSTGGTEAARYLPDLGSLLGLSNATTTQIWDIYNDVPDATLTPAELQLQAGLTSELRDTYALDVFYLVLRDAGRDHNDPSSPGAGNYDAGMAAIGALFSGSTEDAPWPGEGDLSLTSREIKTTNGGNISLLVPGGQVNVGLNVSGVQPLDQGILTDDGGNISIFASGSVNVGTSRIFTLNGGNEIIWSTNGNIDAGASSKTVQSAPPTRVIVDPQSGAVETDLGGLATGGGIGVLETIPGAPPSNVRPDRAQRRRRRRRRRHPRLGQPQHRRSTGAQRLQHPGRRQNEWRADHCRAEHRRPGRRLQRDRCGQQCRRRGGGQPQRPGWARRPAAGPALHHHR